MGLFSDSTTTSVDNPYWDLQAQHLPGIFDQARNIYNTGDTGPYAGDRVAAFDPVRQLGINKGLVAAGDQERLASAGTTGLLGQITGDSAAQQRLAGQAAAGAHLGAAGAGVLGGARGQRAASAAAADSLASNQLNAIGQIGAQQSATLAPAQTYGAAGRTVQDYNQQVIDADQALHGELRSQPFDWLNQYRNVIGTPQAPESKTVSESPSLFNTLVGGASTLSGLGFFAEGGEVEAPQATTNPVWDFSGAVPQLKAGGDRVLPGQAALDAQGSASYVPEQITWNPETQRTQVGSGSSGGTAAAGSGTSNFTTYGGHRDIAHSNIDQAFDEYGKLISAETATNEANPAYNADIAAANADVPVTIGRDDNNEPIVVKASDLTSSHFQNPSYSKLSQEEQMAANYAALAAGGIRNVGGGYAQDDPTTGAWGTVRDIFGNVVENVAELPGTIGTVVDLFDQPDSTYQPVPSNNDDNDNWREEHAARHQENIRKSFQEPGGSSGGGHGGIGGDRFAMGGKVSPALTKLKQQWGVM